MDVKRTIAATENTVMKSDQPKRIIKNDYYRCKERRTYCDKEDIQQNSACFFCRYPVHCSTSLFLV